MLLSKLKKALPLLAVLGFVLSSCEAPLKVDASLSQNVVWTSDDGRLSIYVQGFGNYEGLATMDINGELMRYEASFNDLFDTIELYEINPWVYKYNAPKVEPIEFYIDAIISGKSQMKISADFNETGDGYYDGYSTTITKRSLKEDELDAKYFSNGWVSEEHDLALPGRVDSFLKPRREGTYKEKSVYFRFLDSRRFTIEYQESSEIFASGSYVTHFDNMDLVFDDDCGKDVFGESINMLWCDGVGEPLPPFEG